MSIFESPVVESHFDTLFPPEEKEPNFEYDQCSFCGATTFFFKGTKLVDDEPCHEYCESVGLLSDG